jgi:hypothetical protein
LREKEKREKEKREKEKREKEKREKAKVRYLSLGIFLCDDI